jgi:hypothetical protein
MTIPMGTAMEGIKLNDIKKAFKYEGYTIKE